MESVWRDIRQALRTMSDHKAFSAGVLLTLALGIGANTAMFSLVYGVLLRPLPYADPGQLVRVSEEHPGGIAAALGPRPSYRLHARGLGACLEDDRGHRDVQQRASGSPSVARIPCACPAQSCRHRCSACCACSPLPDASSATTRRSKGAGSVVVLGHGLWRDLYGASPSAIGQTLFLNEKPHLIVGVAPRGFAFPDAEAAFWVPDRVAAKQVDPATASHAHAARHRPAAPGRHARNRRRRRGRRRRARCHASAGASIGCSARVVRSRSASVPWSTR